MCFLFQLKFFQLLDGFVKRLNDLCTLIWSAPTCETKQTSVSVQTEEEIGSREKPKNWKSQQMKYRALSLSFPLASIVVRQLIVKFWL